MLYVLLFFGIVLLDQLTKAVIDANNVHIEIIKDVFSISNVRNEGAAFSILYDVSWAQTFFLIMTVIIVLALCLFLIFTNRKSKFMKISIVMIMGGAIGNFIDRVAFKSVRDFIYPHFYANFNVADIFICVGAFLLAVYLIFFDRQVASGNKEQ